MHSPNITDENVAKLAEIFPNCVTEGPNGMSVDLDLLRQELSDHVVEGPRERYRLDWPGKRQSILTANTPTKNTLRPCREESVDFDDTENLFIEGDNLEALKLLQENYLGKVKMIYIDPPYNTGNDFIYNDSFSTDKEEHDRRSGVKDDEGNVLFDEEKWQKNSDSNGRYHSDWLSMMYPRLKLARNLLREDGVIFISIDDNEAHNLRKMCDEVFGEQNFIAQVIWEKGRKNDAKFFSVGHEYILAYARNLISIREKGEVWREEKPGARDIWDEFLRLKKIHGDDYDNIEADLGKWYSNLPKSHPAKKWSRYRRVDQFGPWRDRDISWPGGDGPRYDVLHPVTLKPCKVPERGWIYSSPKEMQRQIKLGLVAFRSDHTEPPFRKAHIRPIPGEILEISCEDDYEIGEEYDDIGFANQVRGSYFYKQSQVAVKHLRDIMGAKVFNNPKDHEEISRLIEYITPSDKKSIVLDFFAGSASTAESILKVNSNCGTNHRFIMVQLPEPLQCATISGSAKKTSQAAIKMLEKIGLPLTISELSKERIRRAGKRILEGECHQDWNKDVGFRVLKVDSSNMADVYYTPEEIDREQLLLMDDNVKETRTSEDLLFQVMLDWGLELSLSIKVEEIGGKEVYFVDDDAIAACFDRSGGITEPFVRELAARHPLRVVFHDGGFEDDGVKINVEQIFKALSPKTEVRTI
jgi:adenine-specific DNA-methyltransferase